MDFILRTFVSALRLTWGDRTTYWILLRSIYVNGSAVLVSSAIAVPLALLVDVSRLRFKGVILTLFQTLTGIPPVVVGLIVYLFLSRDGPLADLDLLFTKTAMVIAQVMIAFPIAFTVSHSHFAKVDDRIRLIARTLGAGEVQVALKVLRESVGGVVTAIMTAFGRVAGEVGAVMMVGGNIQGRTRIMTTSILLYTEMGEFERAVALGIILLTIAFLINFTIIYLSGAILRGYEG